MSEITYDYLALNAPHELELMQETDPEKFDKLVLEKINQVQLKHSNKIVFTGQKTDTKPVASNNRTFDEFALNAPHELELMQQTDPEKFNRLIADKVSQAKLNYSIAV